MADESIINGKSVRPSGGPVSGNLSAGLMSDRDVAMSAFAAKHGIQPWYASSNEDRAYMYAGIPDSAQPTVSEAKNLYALLNSEQAAQLTEVLDDYYGEGRWDVQYVRGLWEESVDISAQQLKQGIKLPVIDAMSQLISNFGSAARGKSGGGGPKITQTINLTDPGTAEILIDQALQGYLGRKASNKEVKEFRKALTKAEMDSPNTVDVQGSTQIGGGGFNPSQFAQQYAEGMEGSAEYQAATTFLDAFIGAIGPRVDL
tara:strand:+ start:3305 stop:4081 length:777 start_codon:yes stop_codon:yes gene_type:complete